MIFIYAGLGFKGLLPEVSVWSVAPHLLYQNFFKVLSGQSSLSHTVGVTTSASVSLVHDIHHNICTKFNLIVIKSSKEGCQLVLIPSFWRFI